MKFENPCTIFLEKYLYVRVYIKVFLYIHLNKNNYIYILLIYIINYVFLDIFKSLKKL